MRRNTVQTLPLVLLLVTACCVPLFLVEIHYAAYPIYAVAFLLLALQNRYPNRGLMIIVGGMALAFASLAKQEASSEYIVSIVVSFGAAAAAFWFYLSHAFDAEKQGVFEKKLLNELFDKAPEAILLLDFYSRKVVDCNQQAVKLFEVDGKAAIVGDNRDDYIINKLSEQELLECRKQISLKGQWKKVIRHQTKQGNTFWAEVVIIPLQVDKSKYYVTRIKDVTEAIEAKDDLQHTHDRLNAVIDSIGSVVYSTAVLPTGTHILEYASASIQDVLGLTMAEYKSAYMDNRLLGDYCHPDDHDSLIEANRELLKKKKAVRLQYRFKHGTTGEYIWVEEHVFPQFNSNGDHIGNFGISTDVTHRVEYEHALQESEERYRTLFERNLAGVYKARIEDKVILDCNDAFARILGYKTKEDVVGKISSDLYNGSSDKGQFHDMIQDEKSVQSHESQLYLKDGTDVWIMENTRVVEEFGKPSYVEGTLIDITPLKETQEALKKSEENLSLVINSLDDIIYNIEVKEDGTSTFKYISPQIEGILGVEIKEYETLLKDDKLKNFIHPDDLDNVNAMIQVIREKKKPISITYRLRNQSTGNYHWLEENVYPKVDGEQIVAKFGIIRDVTQRKFAEEALRISEKRYRGLFERNLAGVFRLSKDGKVLECNQSFAMMLGYGSDEEVVEGKIGRIYINEAQGKEFLKQIQKQLVLSNHEICLRRKDGSEVWCLANVIYNSEWEVIEGTVIDISELKQTGEALIESEHALSTLLSNLPGMAYRCKIDKDWTMEYVSEGCFDLTGYQPEEVVDNAEISYNEIIHEGHRGGFEDVVSSLKSKSKFVFEYRIVDKEGNEKWVWEQGEAVYDENGEPIALEGFITDITSRKNYEFVINTRREEYQHLVDNSPYGIVIHEDGDILYANQKAYELLGIEVGSEDSDKLMPYEQANKQLGIGKQSIYDFLLPEYHDQAVDRKKLLLEGDDLPFVDVQIKKVSGEIIDVETRSILTIHEGVKAVQVVFNDITAKKQLAKEQARAQAAEELNTQLEQEIREHQRTQQKLKDNQRFTRNLIDSSLDMILASDNDQKITEVNPSATEKFGYTAEELRGQDPRILYANEKEYKRVHKELKEKGKFIGEIENKDRHGNVFSSILSSSIIRNEDGEPVGVMGISRDISEIKDVERAMSEQSSTIKSIFESNSNMLIWIVNDDLNYVSFSKSYFNAAKLILGSEPAQGTNLSETIKNNLTREEFSIFLSYFKRALRGTTQQFESKLTDRRGNEFWLEVYLSPIILEDGTIKEIACLAHEITDKKHVEVKMKESLKEKEILLKEVHHRVKNNLQVISSILNLQSSYVSDENTLGILRESQNRIKSMSFIHESLYQTKDFSSINFSEYILNLSKNLVHSYQITSGGIQLDYDIDQISLELDQAIPCGLIVNELVSNALKYAFEDDTGTVYIGLSQNDETISLKVEDNGVGLPDGFDYENTNTLGLQLVATLVEQLDGNMELKSDKGTKYLITFERQNPE